MENGETEDDADDGVDLVRRVVQLLHGDSVELSNRDMAVSGPPAALSRSIADGSSIVVADMYRISGIWPDQGDGNAGVEVDFRLGSFLSARS